MADVETIDAATAVALHGQEGVVFVDIRDVRELARNGQIPEAEHPPRGMLEYWVDPDSPSHKEVFSTGRRFVFYWVGGGRSALAAKTLQDIGMSNVCYLRDGFHACLEAGGEVAEKSAWWRAGNCHIVQKRL